MGAEVSNFAVVIEGIETVRDFERLGRDVKLNAVRALNKVAEQQRTRSARLIASQVNLPARYLSPSGGRLYVSKKATGGSLESRITARGRPTSLARFVTGNPGFNKPGVTVKVKPGQASYLRRAFLIKLNKGAGQTDTQFNAGLAIRLKSGERLANKTAAIKLNKNLYLLYGPSIQQVFLDNSGSGVADDIAGETAIKLEREFLRLMNL
jgi:hypothetical protein